MPLALFRAGLAAITALGLTACSGNGAADSEAAVSSGDPASCPGEIVDVVVSVGQWSDLARRLGGACATVTTVRPLEPRDGRPAAADLAVFAHADLVLVNGAGYDEWAAAAVGKGDDHPVVVSAAEMPGAHEPGSPEADPRLWHDPAVVPQVAAALARALGDLSPDAAPYFGAQHDTWTAELRPYLDTVAALRAEHEGRRYAATDPVYDRVAAAVGLTDVTPRGYDVRPRGYDADGDPAPADVAAFEALLRTGGVDVLIRDGQAGGEVRERLREVAEDAGVPVVDVHADPDEDTSFVEWQLAQLADLSAALAAHR